MFSRLAPSRTLANLLYLERGHLDIDVWEGEWEQ